MRTCPLFGGKCGQHRPMTGPNGLADRAPAVGSGGRTAARSKVYKTGTSNSVSWASALGSRARNGNTSVSIMLQVVVTCYNAWA